MELLAPRLEEAGHKVENVWLPFSSDPATMLTEMAAFRLANYESSFDMVICTRPPAHIIRHSRKVLWFIHHERIFYDLWDSEYNQLPRTDRNIALRDAIRTADMVGIAEAKTIFANSRIVAERLRTFNQVKAEILYPPIADDFRPVSAIYGDELLFNCRLADHKRQHLAIEAMGRTKTPVRLRVVGRAHSSDYLGRLRTEIKTLQLDDRITLDDRWISEGEKRHLLTQALASVYIPFDEDSYGYPTLEAAHARRATISTTDAGGVQEFIRDGKNGLLCEPTPDALAAAFDRLWGDRAFAQRLGEAAEATVASMKINWRRVVERLTA